MNMCQVLNMSQFWIFKNIYKYDRVLYMCSDAIMEGFCILQDSKYPRFLCMQVLYKILNLREYGWMMPYERVPWGFKWTSGSKYARAHNMARLLIYKCYTGCWICLNKPEYASIMSPYVWIYFNNAGYDWIYWHILK